HMRKTVRSAVGVVKGSHDAARPEQRPVLARAPALVRHAADVARLGDLLPRLVRRDVLRGVEVREVLAENFLRRVAADALGSAVPAADEAVAVEHENRVVVDALDEQTEAFLALL